MINDNNHKNIHYGTNTLQQMKLLYITMGGLAVLGEAWKETFGTRVIQKHFCQFNPSYWHGKVSWPNYSNFFPRWITRCLGTAWCHMGQPGCPPGSSSQEKTRLFRHNWTSLLKLHCFCTFQQKNQTVAFVIYCNICHVSVSFLWEYQWHGKQLPFVAQPILGDFNYLSDHFLL